MIYFQLCIKITVTLFMTFFESSISAHTKQECIPIGCVLPARNPLDRDHLLGTDHPWTQTPLDRDPPDRDPLGRNLLHRDSPQTETLLDTDHPLVRDPLDRDPPLRTDTPCTETPLDRDLCWTDRHLWKHNLCKLHLRAVKMSLEPLYTCECRLV